MNNILRQLALYKFLQLWLVPVGGIVKSLGARLGEKVLRPGSPLAPALISLRSMRAGPIASMLIFKDRAD